MTKIFGGLLFLIGMIGPAAAIIVPVPAPEMGEGAIGMLLAACAVYLIKRRARG